jgi:hypothetical protein
MKQNQPIEKKPPGQSGLEPFQHRCPNCSHMFMVSSEIMVRQLELLIAERDMLKRRLEEK